MPVLDTAKEKERRTRSTKHENGMAASIHLANERHTDRAVSYLLLHRTAVAIQHDPSKLCTQPWIATQVFMHLLHRLLCTFC